MEELEDTADTVGYILEEEAVCKRFRGCSFALAPELDLALAVEWAQEWDVASLVLAALVEEETGCIVVLLVECVGMWVIDNLAGWPVEDSSRPVLSDERHLALLLLQ